MASPYRPVKLSHDLNAAVDIRWQALGYKSYSAYIKGLIRYDMLVQGPHDASLPLSIDPEDKQLKVDAELLKLTKKGVGVRGQLLKRLIEQSKTSGQSVMDELLQEATKND